MMEEVGVGFEADVEFVEVVAGVEVERAGEGDFFGNFSGGGEGAVAGVPVVDEGDFGDVTQLGGAGEIEVDIFEGFLFCRSWDTEGEEGGGGAVVEKEEVRLRRKT